MRQLDFAAPAGVFDLQVMGTREVAARAVGYRVARNSVEQSADEYLGGESSGTADQRRNKISEFLQRMFEAQAKWGNTC